MATLAVAYCCGCCYKCFYGYAVLLAPILLWLCSSTAVSAAVYVTHCALLVLFIPAHLDSVAVQAVTRLPSSKLC
jgi:hypothetical protein